MTKQCNINSRGKIIRLAGGFVLVLSAGALTVLTALGSIDGVWPWVAVVSFLAIGAFAVYEGWAGWCAIRAIGVNTWF